MCNFFEEFVEALLTLLTQFRKLPIFLWMVGGANRYASP